MRSYGEALIRLFYPAYCGVCRSFLRLEEEALCRACRADLDTLRFSTDEIIVEEKFTWLDDAWALYPYRPPVRAILSAVKFSRKRGLLTVFQNDMRTWYESTNGETHYDYLVPVPMNHARLMVRHFNQSALIAHRLSAITGIPLFRGLRKIRMTAAQSQLPRSERKWNLRDSMRAVRPGRLQGHSLLLIDDILTTGATADEAARVLKKNGAARVDLFTLARSVLKGSVCPA